MARTIELRRLIDRSLASELAQLGFVRERRNMYRLPRSDNISGVVTFPTKFWKGLEWEYSPNIGVRHEGINKLIYRISDDEQESERSLNILVAQILTNIGYLMPKQRFISWSLPPDIAPQGTVLEIVNAIKTFGMPFIDVHSEPAVFRETLEGGKYTILNQDE